MGNSGYQLHKACPVEKSIYSQCEDLYWKDFREGKALISPCREEFENYKNCVDQVFRQNQQQFLLRKQQKKEQEAKKE